MAIKHDPKRDREAKQEKLDQAVQQLDAVSAEQQEHTHHAIRAITGEESGTRTIIDKNGRARTVKVKEQRKTMPIYLPQSIYDAFDEIVAAKHRSRNGVIVELIQDYIEKEMNQ